MKAAIVNIIVIVNSHGAAVCVSSPEASVTAHTEVSVVVAAVVLIRHVPLKDRCTVCVRSLSPKLLTS